MYIMQRGYEKFSLGYFGQWCRHVPFSNYRADKNGGNQTAENVERECFLIQYSEFKLDSFVLWGIEWCSVFLSAIYWFSDGNYPGLATFNYILDFAPILSWWTLIIIARMIIVETAVTLLLLITCRHFSIFEWNTMSFNNKEQLPYYVRQ